MWRIVGVKQAFAISIVEPDPCVTPSVQPPPPARAGPAAAIAGAMASRKVVTSLVVVRIADLLSFGASRLGYTGRPTEVPLRARGRRSASRRPEADRSRAGARGRRVPRRGC